MKTPESMYYEWRQMWDESTDENICAGRPMINPTTDLGMLVFLAGYQAAKQWISVKDRLPEEGQDVLVFDEGTISVKSLSSYTHKWHPYENGFDCEPSHWMPLPAAPKGEG